MENSNKKSSIGARTVVTAVAVGILLAFLATAAVLFVLPSNHNNKPQTTSTPASTAPAQTLSPTTPTLTPTPAPTPQPQNNTITAINLQFVYQSSDQGYFGPNSQTMNFNNQPNGMLSIYQGQQFWYSFKLTEASSASPDSITSIEVTTPGFSIVSVTPQTPISFTEGSSVTITVTLQSPQETFNGAVNLVLTTSG